MTVDSLRLADKPKVAVISGKAVWTWWEKLLFRFLFIFVAILVLPIDADWYTRFFNSTSFFGYLSSLAGYRINLVQLTTESGRWGIGAYATWGIAALIAIGGAIMWSLIAIKSKRTNYNLLYYWTRVVIRYRAAIGIIAFGFLKVYPMQMPYPPLSNLLTDFGDYNTYKIYWQHVGVSTWYQILLGWVEVIGGVLLFFRATTFPGALITAGVLFNIAHANLAYDGGVHVYSSFFVLFCGILLIPYVAAFWKLFVQQKDVHLKFYYPSPDTKRKRIIFNSIKFAFIILFTVVYGVLRYDVHYIQGSLKIPVSPGLSNAKGYYNVTEFKLGDQVLPYDPLDSVRWQSVVLENWSTLVYKVHKAFPVSLTNGTPNVKQIDRSYELAGIAGGLRFLHYEADTVNHKLYLWDKGRRRVRDEGAGRAGRGRQRNNANAVTREEEKPEFEWSYERISPTRIILSGLNDNKDPIRVVLDKTDRQFAIQDVPVY
ncbi:MAG: hypothetical protein KIT80_17195 [Chitinophagaceae bacterium]|nr:hypothetical protein [Chitinophagaceae bacterium]MCW5928658.1 hypothetical protein [Chitinophagaceae bacterium]